MEFESNGSNLKLQPYLNSVRIIAVNENNMETKKKWTGT